MLENDERIATAGGAMLADPARVGNLLSSAGEALFEPEFWAGRGELIAVSGGRGGTWYLDSGPRRWVLRHYRRGGFMARLSQDRYLWAGESRVRAFAEYRLLGVLARHGLPVPRAVAARYRRADGAGLTYRCDLIMERICDAQPLSALLAAAVLSDASWYAVGAAIARLHAARVDHADLNAHNILIDTRGGVSIIDFDRGRMHEGAPPAERGARSGRGAWVGRGAWTGRNLERLHRSLAKVSRALPPDRFSPEDWGALLAGYGAERA